MKTINFFLLLLLIFTCQIPVIQCCNEAVCISVVSKCLLLKSCMCLSDNYTCHKACFDCLGSYNSQCCTCLEFCPKSEDIVDGLDSQSVIEDFPESIPGLFRALTEYPDDLNRWATLTFLTPIDNEHKSNKELKLYEQPGEDNKPSNSRLTVNCTVIFINNCVSWTKCKRNCLTMGANSYRWFYNGCCECIGEYCIYHGVDVSRCQNCPGDEDEEDFDYDDDYYNEQF